MDTKHKCVVYKELIIKIGIDSVFLIAWAFSIKLIHETLLPLINVQGIPGKIIDIFALLFDISVSATILALIVIDLHDELKQIWRGRVS